MARMGTRGYRVYRYRNVYFTRHNSHDSYPEGLGLEVLDCARWSDLSSKREELGEILDELDGDFSKYQYHDEQDFGDNYRITEWRPENDDTFVEWVYEIDLDHNIFHINGIPFFSLECIPDESTFLECVSEEDHYGHLTCPPTCPPEQKFKRSAPPVIDDSEIATYQSLPCTGTQVALSDLLGISDALSPDEDVRVSLLEVMIGQYMIKEKVPNIIHNALIWAPGSEKLNASYWFVASSMANLAFIPQIFDSEFIRHPRLDVVQEFTWIRQDTVLYISMYLHDDRCLQASLSCLIDEILKETDGFIGDYFGIAFSIFHCAIVKVVKDEHTTTFSHTAALEFIPSFYADSPSTPGITALARLGYRIDPELFERVLDISHPEGPRTRVGKERIDYKEPPIQGGEVAPPSTGCAELPPELWREVALHLQLSDLLTFGSVSRLCREVASEVLRYPHLCGYRLVAVDKEKQQYMMEDYVFLSASCFFAERPDIDISVTLLVGLQHYQLESKLIYMSVPFGYTSTRIRAAEVRSDDTALENILDPEKTVHSDVMLGLFFCHPDRGVTAASVASR